MDHPIKVLIVDDDPQIRELLCACLTGFGMAADVAANGTSMHRLLRSAVYDIIVLDLMLPGEDGLVLCREIRATSDIPIIILSARSQSTERIVGIELGADDYMVKPFEPRELVVRIQAIVRRTRGGDGARRMSSEIQFADWRLNVTARHLIAPDGTVVTLSSAEFRLLSILLDAPGRVLSRDFLLDALRGRGANSVDRSIDVQMSRLRTKLREDVKDPQLIRTIRGEGYLLNAQILG
ncbi:response regulator [Paraburkholderia sediminicola]|uniref:response regulator n=1 Tax=Paraburkholderia sediminicola TaxID=458836 RepID=UPI0038B8121F